MIEIILLVSSILFIFALKLFGRPSTAHRANTFAMLAMALAVFSAFNFDFSKYDSAFYITVVASGLLGVLISKRVQMTQMPELVGLFNGFGGGASGAIAYVELSGNSLPLSDVFVAIFSMVIGMFTFSGSLIAVMKLRGKLNNFSKKLLKYPYTIMLMIKNYEVFCRLTAAGPFSASSTSNVSSSPSFKNFKPASLTADACTNTSFSLSSLSINP